MKDYLKQLLKNAGLKGQAINEDIAYHGTANKFDEFSLKYINSGEGAQVHGWGIYFALDKDIAQNYKSKLSSLWDKKYKSFDKEQRDWLKQIDRYGYEKTLQDAEDELVKLEKEYETADEDTSDDEDDAFFHVGPNRLKSQVSEDIKHFKRKIEFIKSLNNTSVEALADDYGAVFTVDVPPLDTMIDEQKSLVNQSAFVQKVIRNNIFNPNIFNVLTYVGLTNIYDFYDKETINYIRESDILKNLNTSKRIWNLCCDEIYKESKIGYNDDSLFNAEQLYEVLKKGLDKALKYTQNWLDMTNNSFYEEKINIFKYIDENILVDLCKKYDSFMVESIDNITGKELYDLIVHAISMYPGWNIKGNIYARVSMLLLKYGIQGIKYNGMQDGDCVVIFNPKRVKIVSKE